MSLFERIVSQIGGSPDKKKKNSLQTEFDDLLQDNMDRARDSYASEDAEGNEIKNEELERFFETVKKRLAGHMPERIFDANEEKDSDETGESAETFMKNAACLFHISEDRMNAFACILPPVNGGADMTAEIFKKELYYAGITYGVDETIIKETIKDQDYLNPFLVAAGTPAKDGKDGILTEHFRREACFRLEGKEGEAIDFDQEIAMQIVKKDAVICHITAAEKAIDGKDVTGKVLKAADGASVELKKGAYTYLSASGRELLAEVDGVISITDDGNFCVKPQRTVSGHAGRHTGNIYHKGDLYIEGNVSGDIVIKADGDLIIGGEVRDAQIEAGKNIRIQKGISKGQAETTIKAGGEVQCATIENVMVTAGADIYAGVIMNSDVFTEGSVYVTAGRGLLAGGSIKARKNVTAREIGNISGCKNIILVGHDPAIREKIETLRKDLHEGDGTLEMLQKNISTLKAVGSNNLPPEKRDLLHTLMEQRTLYEERAEKLKAEIKQLNVTLHKSSMGTISCDKIYPVTEAYIGEKKTVITRMAEPCRIFVTGDNIVVR